MTNSTVGVRRPRPNITSPEWRPRSLHFKVRNPLLKRFLKWWRMQRLPEGPSGPADLSDLRAPGQTAPASIPAYYLFQPVHHMPVPGYLGRKQGPRLEKSAEENFQFGNAANIRSWIADNVVDAEIRPRRILEVGGGVGSTAQVYAAMFPEAEVICTDLSPELLRWGRQRSRQKGLHNIAFYQMDAADLSAFETDSFDIVHEAHMLHEMPASHQYRALREMARVCRPGGLLGFFDWAIPETEADWEHRAWKVRTGGEPFMLEYARFNFPAYLEAIGCEGTLRIERHSNSATWKAFKGPQTNAILARTSPTLDQAIDGRASPKGAPA